MQHILLIDDDPQIINLIIDYFEYEGYNYRFYQALDGVTALKIANKKQPDLIIIDWEMPNMNGIETIKHLKQNVETQHIPIIMLTGIMTSTQHLKVALSAGAVDYIRKPIDSVELVARTHSMLMFADYYKQIIAAKNRELTSTAVNLLQKNELITNIVAKIQKISDNFARDNKALLQELKYLMNDLNYNMQDEVWKQFENYFREVSPDFLDKLLSRFPHLTQNDLKLCSFIRMNVSTKEMSAIMFITPDSVRIARNRLRKKLGLPPGAKLAQFLAQI